MVDAVFLFCTLIPIPKNQDLQQIGQRCRTIYFVKGGLAGIFYLKDGTEVREQFIFDNDLILRTESFLPEFSNQSGMDGKREAVRQTLLRSIY